MSDIFREVEEDIRREQLKRVWDRFGVYIIAVAVLIVVATAGWRGWQWYSAQQAAEAGQRYYDALQLARDGNSQEAEAAFSEIAAEGGGFAALARLRTAATLADAGNTADAVAAYDAVAGSGSFDQRLRDVARIRAGYILLGENDPGAVNDRVGQLAAEGNYWRHSAREILGLAAYQAGDMDTATQRFDELLADNETPRDMRNRAQLMIALLAAERPANADQDAGEADTQ